MAQNSIFSLRNKVVLQFGGTGQLGAALMEALSSAGATLVVASRNPSSTDTGAKGENAANRDVNIETVDVTSERSLHSLRDRVLAQHGRVDGVVFNVRARIMHGMQEPLEAWRGSMEVNATGLFATLRTFGDVMAKRGSGSIVSIASIHGMVGMNPWLYEDTPMTASPDYFFHKGGMINLTRYLASHYGGRNVRVNAVSPGGIFNPEKPQASAFVERYRNMTMLGRMANPHDVDGAVVFLLSDASCYITGINIPVDGGYGAK